MTKFFETIPHNKNLNTGLGGGFGAKSGGKYPHHLCAPNVQNWVLINLHEGLGGGGGGMMKNQSGGTPSFGSLGQKSGGMSVCISLLTASIVGRL